MLFSLPPTSTRTLDCPSLRHAHILKTTGLGSLLANLSYYELLKIYTHPTKTQQFEYSVSHRTKK